MTVSTMISRYAEYMRQVKYRTDVVSRCLKHHSCGTSLTGYRETDIELCYLQLRKSLELIMFSSVIAHDSFGLKLSNHLKDKEYSASQILKKIRHLNPNYYPVPVEDSVPVNGIRKVERIDDGYLTESEFCRLYDRVCGENLHADRRDPYAGRHDEHFTEIGQYHAKLVRLLNHHWVHVTENVALAVLMQTNTGGDVQVTHMSALSRP